MVHPNFAQQTVPRPAAWETPSLNRQNYRIVKLPLLGSISERLTQYLYGVTDANARNQTLEFLRREDGFDQSQNWDAGRMLGAGAYGEVALWIRISDDGVILDEIALKQTGPLGQDSDHHLYTNSRGQRIYDLMNEAVVHKVANQYECENITRLRNYKVVADRLIHPDEPAPSHTEGELYRYFMEYAPYGTLDTLIERYRAWNQYLPEAFLWHAFDSLAHAIYNLSVQPDDMDVAGETRSWPDGSEILHFDIKPSNIVMGYEILMDEQNSNTGGGRRLPYPTIKLSDFGISVITHPDDDGNPRRQFDAGTTYYMPPEQVQYGVSFFDPPNGRYRPVIDVRGNHHNIIQEERNDPDPKFRFSSKSAVWAIGKVMYDLATLSTSHTFQHNWNWREPDYIQDNKQLLPDFNSTPFTYMFQNRSATHIPNYTPALMDIIARCLVPTMADRIDITDLINLLGPHITREDVPRTDDDNDGRDDPDDGHPRRSVKRRRLYYQDTEINNMPTGTADFDPNDTNRRFLLNPQYVDPDWAQLQLPRGKFSQYLQPRQPRIQRPRDWNIVRGRIYFSGRAPPGSSPLSSDGVQATPPAPAQQGVQTTNGHDQNTPSSHGATVGTPSGSGSHNTSDDSNDSQGPGGGGGGGGGGAAVGVGASNTLPYDVVLAQAAIAAAGLATDLAQQSQANPLQNDPAFQNALNNLIDQGRDQLPVPSGPSSRAPQANTPMRLPEQPPLQQPSQAQAPLLPVVPRQSPQQNQQDRRASSAPASMGQGQAQVMPLPAAIPPRSPSPSPVPSPSPPPPPPVRRSSRIAARQQAQQAQQGQQGTTQATGRGRGRGRGGASTRATARGRGGRGRAARARG